LINHTQYIYLVQTTPQSIIASLKKLRKLRDPHPIFIIQPEYCFMAHSQHHLFMIYKLLNRRRGGFSKYKVAQFIGDNIDDGDWNNFEVSLSISDCLFHSPVLKLCDNQQEERQRRSKHLKTTVLETVNEGNTQYHIFILDTEKQILMKIDIDDDSRFGRVISVQHLEASIIDTTSKMGSFFIKITNINVVNGELHGIAFRQTLDGHVKSMTRCRTNYKLDVQNLQWDVEDVEDYFHVRFSDKSNKFEICTRIGNIKCSTLMHQNVSWSNHPDHQYALIWKTKDQISLIRCNLKINKQNISEINLTTTNCYKLASTMFYFFLSEHYIIFCGGLSNKYTINIFDINRKKWTQSKTNLFQILSGFPFNEEDYDEQDYHEPFICIYYGGNQFKVQVTTNKHKDQVCIAGFIRKIEDKIDNNNNKNMRKMTMPCYIQTGIIQKYYVRQEIKLVYTKNYMSWTFNADNLF